MVTDEAHMQSITNLEIQNKTKKNKQRIHHKKTNTITNEKKKKRKKWRESLEKLGKSLEW